jgi:bacillithiol biosynthesis deacetylase BshB1
MKLDILVIAAHPDDAELGAGGSIAKAVNEGLKVGILDLTRGELGTRGTPETRENEASAAADILGVVVRENADLPDGFLANTKEFQLRILPFIRNYQPDIVLANAIRDRHPDHAKASKLISDACFLSGLKAIETEWEGEKQESWRPNAVYHFVQDYYIKPDFIVDITETWETKMKAVKAFSSQFYQGKDDKGPVTPISTKGFIQALEARAREYGRLIKSEFGEGFTVERPPGVKSFRNLI